MKPINHKSTLWINVPLGDWRTINHHLFGFITSPTNLSGINRIFQDIADRATRPITARGRGDPERVQTMRYDITADFVSLPILSGITISKQAEDHANNFSLRLHDAEGIAFAILDMDALIALRTATGNYRAFLCGSKPTGI